MSNLIKLSQKELEVKLFEKVSIVIEDERKIFCLSNFPYYNVPFHFGMNQRIQKPYTKMNDFPKFLATLRPEQVQVFNDARRLLLEQSTCMISCFTGFGKTITTIALACFLQLKTVIVIHRVCLLEQWKSSIQQFAPNSIIKIFDSEQNNDDDYHFAIVNICNIPKFNFKSANLVILDETHLLLSEKRSINLLKLLPVKMIGLTATPYRPDELHILFKLFFGENYIIRKLQKPHAVYVVNTGLEIKEKRLYNRKLDWNHVLEQQSTSESRNKLVKLVIDKFKNRTWLILVKRIKHAELLKKILESSYKVSVLVGSTQTFDHECEILIGTVSKIGTGFDYPKLNSLIVAADMVEYYIQYLGRIMRTKDNPIVVDFVDSHPILQYHFEKRKKVYLDHGGKIMNASISSVSSM